MGSFLKSVLKNNIFEVNLELYFEQPNSKDPLDKIEIQAKIDTGYYDSFISYYAMFVILSDVELEREKAKWLRLRRYSVGCGVETNSKHIVRPKTLQDAIKNKHVVISNKYYDISIGGVSIGNRILHTSYDRNDKVLLGMGIFKDWDFHVGKNANGETIFLGCPNSKLNQDYYEALEKEFNIASKLNAAIVNKQIR